MLFSVVVPVYGCRGALRELYQRLTNTLCQITQEYEIILVNDNCPQNSLEIIEQLCKEDSHVVGIELSRNFGQIKAITAGLEYSSGDYVVVMDCDLQDAPEEILNLYNKLLKTESDVVFAKRKNRQDNKTKIFVSKCFYKVYSWMTDDNYDADLCNFSVCKRVVIDNYLRMRETHRAFVMYIKWLGFKQEVLEVEHNERKEGKSSYDFKRRLNLAFSILTSQSEKLLLLNIKFGVIISALSFLYILYLVFSKFFFDITIGYTTIVASIYLVCGLILTSLGVIGAYIGNIFMQVKERPLYVVRNIMNKEKKR